MQTPFTLSDMLSLSLAPIARQAKIFSLRTKIGYYTVAYTFAVKEMHLSQVEIAKELAVITADLNLLLK